MANRSKCVPPRDHDFQRPGNCRFPFFQHSRRISEFNESKSYHLELCPSMTSSKPDAVVLGVEKVSNPQFWCPTRIIVSVGMLEREVQTRCAQETGEKAEALGRFLRDLPPMVEPPKTQLHEPFPVFHSLQNSAASTKWTLNYLVL